MFECGSFSIGKRSSSTVDKVVRIGGAQSSGERDRTAYFSVLGRTRDSREPSDPPGSQENELRRVHKMMGVNYRPHVVEEEHEEVNRNRPV